MPSETAKTRLEKVVTKGEEQVLERTDTSYVSHKHLLRRKKMLERQVLRIQERLDAINSSLAGFVK